MPETLREQVENRVKVLVVPGTDPRDTFDYGAFDVSTGAVQHVFPWLKPLIGDKFLPPDYLARVVLHSAGGREKVVRRGIGPFKSERREVVPGYKDISLILPSGGRGDDSALQFSWRLVEGTEGRFFIGSTQLPVTEDQLDGLNSLLQDCVQEIRSDHPWFPSQQD